MARVTVEDCLQFVANRYELVHLCTRRSRQLHQGADPLLQCKNNQVVTALREIAGGFVRFLPFREELMAVAEEAPAETVAEVPITNGTKLQH